MTERIPMIRTERGTWANHFITDELIGERVTEALATHVGVWEFPTPNTFSYRVEPPA